MSHMKDVHSKIAQRRYFTMRQAVTTTIRNLESRRVLANGPSYVVQNMLTNLSVRIATKRNKILLQRRVLQNESFYQDSFFRTDIRLVGKVSHLSKHV